MLPDSSKLVSDKTRTVHNAYRVIGQIFGKIKPQAGDMGCRVSVTRGCFYYYVINHKGLPLKNQFNLRMFANNYKDKQLQKLVIRQLIR